MSKKELIIEMVDGIEGGSLYLNDYRIAGPRPLGGGITIARWRANRDTIDKVLKKFDETKTKKAGE